MQLLCKMQVASRFVRQRSAWACITYLQCTAFACSAAVHIAKSGRVCSRQSPACGARHDRGGNPFSWRFLGSKAPEPSARRAHHSVTPLQHKWSSLMWSQWFAVEYGPQWQQSTPAGCLCCRQHTAEYISQQHAAQSSDLFSTVRVASTTRTLSQDRRQLVDRVPDNSVLIPG